MVYPVRNRNLKKWHTKLSITITDKEELQHHVISQIQYARKLQEDARIYRLRLDENPDAIFSNENCYVAGCYFTYLDSMVDELIEYYDHLIPERIKVAHYAPKKLRFFETKEKLEISINKKQANSTELFSLLLPKESQNEFLSKFYIFLKSVKAIESSFPLFERHFYKTKEAFEKIIWKNSIPLMKHTFLYLENKSFIEVPSGNIDKLLSKHFLNSDGGEVGENYLSQSLSRLSYDSDTVVKLHSRLQELISNYSSNKT